ncbi:DHHW family protein [Paenibacillus sp. 1P07SE]|uniref:DHHW family protein n=1 Tax=Paenibacillus sp. 1P07SE TaxID=3132209 RepID=UPI0039A4396A
MTWEAKRSSVTGLLLLIFIGAIAAANLLTADKTFSASENRVLAGRPEFSWHAIRSGQYTTDHERYTTDQFAFRDAWVGAKTEVDRAWGKKDSNGVYLGRDGYLLEHYTSPSADQLQDRVQAIRAFSLAAPELRTHLLLAPTAAALMADKLPDYAPVGDQASDLSHIRRLLPASVRYVDAYAALAAHRERPLFYRTDHHWTTEGAYHAYRELGRQMGFVPQDEAAFDIRQVTGTFYGSLYSKSGYRRLEPDRMSLYLHKPEERVEVTYVDEGRVADSLYELEHLDKKDKYAIFLNGNHGLIRIRSEAPADSKLLVVKDSYANSLIPFLTKHFGEIHVVDLRYYDEPLLELVQEHRIRDMLILYNAKTFFEDPSILNITEGIQ